jgi:hypothetical protein
LLSATRTARETGGHYEIGKFAVRCENREVGC